MAATGALTMIHPKKPCAGGFERHSSITEDITYGYVIPADEILDSADKAELTQIYWKYINTLQYLCRNQTRIGSLQDGGKEICVDNKYLLRKPCLVYSFGSNFQFDFEQDIFRLFGCEIHTFDPSKSPNGKPVPREILTFHVKGLSSEDFVTKNKWVMRKLSTLITELHHGGRVIDLLKIDTEGAEWVALPDIFEDGILRRVRQLSLEVHFSGEREDRAKQLKILRQLHDIGFKIFMHEHNLFSIQNYGEPIGAITDVNEITLVNEKFKSDP